MYPYTIKFYLFDMLYRIKAYIENRWGSKVVNPDLLMGSCSSKDLMEVDSTVSPPTEAWQSIQSAFSTHSVVPKFSLSNVIYCFVTRITIDGRAANNFKSINKSAEIFFDVAMYKPWQSPIRTSIGGLRVNVAQK